VSVNKGHQSQTRSCSLSHLLNSLFIRRNNSTTKHKNDTTNRRRTYSWHCGPLVIGLALFDPDRLQLYYNPYTPHTSTFGRFIAAATWWSIYCCRWPCRRVLVRRSRGRSLHAERLAARSRCPLYTNHKAEHRTVTDGSADSDETCQHGPMRRVSAVKQKDRGSWTWKRVWWHQVVIANIFV